MSTDKVIYAFYHESAGRDSAVQTPCVSLNIFPHDSMFAAAYRFPSALGADKVYISVPEHYALKSALDIVWLLEHNDAPIDRKIRIAIDTHELCDYFCIRNGIIILTQLLKRAVYLWNIKRVLRAKDMKPGVSFIKRMTLRSGLGALSDHHFYHGVTWEPTTLRATLSILYIQQVSPYAVKRVPIIQGWNGTLKTPIPGATSWVLTFHTEAGEECTPEHVYCRASVLRDTPWKTIVPFYIGESVKLYVTYGTPGTISTITDVNPRECYLYLHSYIRSTFHDVFSGKMTHNRRYYN